MPIGVYKRSKNIRREPHTDATKRKISISTKIAMNRPETKRKQRLSHLNHIPSKKTCKKLSKELKMWWRNNRFTKKVKDRNKKISLSRIKRKKRNGFLISKEARKKNSLSHTNVKLSKIHRRNIGAARKNKTFEEIVGEKKANKWIDKIKNNPVVHHINGNHNDNNLLNRMILSRKEHCKIHCILRKLKKEEMMMSGVLTKDNPNLRGEIF